MYQELITNISPIKIANCYGRWTIRLLVPNRQVMFCPSLRLHIMTIGSVHAIRETSSLIVTGIWYSHWSFSDAGISFFSKILHIMKPKQYLYIILVSFQNLQKSIIHFIFINSTLMHFVSGRKLSAYRKIGQGRGLGHVTGGKEVTEGCWPKIIHYCLLLT